MTPILIRLPRPSESRSASSSPAAGPSAATVQVTSPAAGPSAAAVQVTSPAAGPGAVTAQVSLRRVSPLMIHMRRQPTADRSDGETIMPLRICLTRPSQARAVTPLRLRIPQPSRKFS